MLKPIDSTTGTIPSSIDITTIVNLPALFYKWDGIKRTRKKAFTHYITFYNSDYRNCPRRLKKAKKCRAVRGVYYSKGGVYIFNPKLFRVPIPQTIWDMFAKKSCFESSGGTMRFRRYNSSIEAT